MKPLPAVVSSVPTRDYLDSIGEAASEVITTTASARDAMLSNPEPWNFPKYRDAFRGLAGELVDVLYPHTEAAPFALLAQFLAAIGSVVGRTAFQLAEADRHYSNLFVCIVGDTSRSRKGSSWSQVRRVVEIADPDWSRSCIYSGLSTGEGLIHHVRDSQNLAGQSVSGKRSKSEPDTGMADKRLFVMATEFASILAVMSRAGNTLSATLRDAWDGRDLRTMSKGAPERATGAHVSVVAHITRDELRRELTSTESANGFGNRFLWLAVHRSKYLPDGGSLLEAEVERLARSLRKRLEHGRAVTLMHRDDEARDLWRSEYEQLTAGHPGLLGAVTSRAEAQVLRISQIYALLDLSKVVQAKHIASALAVWRYSEDSARLIFGDARGDVVADGILAAVKQGPGMSRDDAVNLFNRHVSRDRIQTAIAALVHSGAIITQQESTGGRPVTRLYPATDASSASAEWARDKREKRGNP